MVHGLDIFSWRFHRYFSANAPFIIPIDLSRAADEHPRLIHHLGPRYTGNLQDSDLVKFLTYEASTSLTMFMSNVASKAGASSEQLSLLKAIKDGLALPESSILLSLSAGSVPQSGFIGTLEVPRHGDDGHQKLQELSVNGDVYVVKAACLDEALWRLGGAAVAMRLVQLAKVANLRFPELQGLRANILRLVVST